MRSAREQRDKEETCKGDDQQEETRGGSISRIKVVVCKPLFDKVSSF